MHGLPLVSSSATKFHYIHNPPSTDLSSSLRLWKTLSVLSANKDSSVDANLKMLNGDSKKNDDLLLSFIDVSDEPFQRYLEPSRLKYVLGKSSLLQQQNRQRRSSLLKTQSNTDSIMTALNHPSDTSDVANFNQLNEPIRLSSSLKKLVKTNPLARAWLTVLLKKITQEQTTPYIFKYGRRRK